MDKSAIDEAPWTLAGWQRHGDRIVKTYVLDSFRAATDFACRVVDAAVATGHEPEIRIRSNGITLAILAPGAVTSADRAFADRADRLVHIRHPVGMVGDDRLVGEHRHPVGMAGH